jgi:gamma-glutamyltranspeptidase
MALHMGRVSTSEMYTTISFDESSSTENAGDAFPPRPRLSLIENLKTVACNSTNFIVLTLMVTIMFVVAALLRTVTITTGYSDEKICPAAFVDIGMAQRKQYFAQSSNDMVVTDNSQCSTIAAAVLEEGGYAVDAAIAAALCLGVVSPASSGLGGGCFLLGYNASERKARFIDARETAPMFASEDMFVSDPIKAQDGGLAIATLGELKGLELAYREMGGGVTWDRIVQPAAKLAEKWIIGPVTADLLKHVESQLFSGRFPELSQLYLKPACSGCNKMVLKSEGDAVMQPQLAATLRNISVFGSNYLYVQQANTLAAEIQEAGGIITADDIKKYSAVFREPLRADIFGRNYYGAPPPSSGGATVATVILFLSGYTEPIVSMGGVYFHRLAEAFKHAFALRMSLGDPDFTANTTKLALSAMLNASYISNLRNITSDEKCLSELSDYGGIFSGFENIYDSSHANQQRKPLWFIPEDHGTSHISVVDKFGNAVSVTTTINTYFGSKVISKSTGILFNNEMDDFSIPNSTNFFGLHPSKINYIFPLKRPLSSMSPMILTDRKNGRVNMVGGASGGPHIITSTAQVLLNFLARGMDLLAAVSEPRLHSQLIPDSVYLENRTM